MMIRLRPKYTDAQLQALYSKQEEQDQWADHKVRVHVMLGVAQIFGTVESVADLACGDGWVVDRISASRRYKGDLAEGYEFTGSIEQTVSEIPLVDLFILSGLERIDDPISLLKKVRAKTQRLVLSTPNGESDPDMNPEHYWGWSNNVVLTLLKEAGFEPVCYAGLELTDYPYDFQIWACK